MKKKFLIPVILMSCAIMMSACGSEENTTSQNTTPSVEEIVEVEETKEITPVVKETTPVETEKVETEKVEETTPTTTPEVTTPSNGNNKPSTEVTKPSTETTAPTNPQPTQPTQPVHTHNYSSVVTSQPGCTTNGVVTYTCSCGDSYTESIPATGHNFSSNQPTCSNCGTDNPNYQPPHTHTWETSYLSQDVAIEAFLCQSCFTQFDSMSEVKAHIDSSRGMCNCWCNTYRFETQTIPNGQVCTSCGARQ